MKFQQEYEKCLEKLTWATKQLQVEFEPSKLAEIAELIVATMTGKWRYFHTPSHIFEVGGNSDAIEKIAALFHDLVYVQIDSSINFNISYYLAGFIEESQGKLKIRDRSCLPKDSSFEIVLSIFGFSEGQVLLPFGGQNEFLSAVVAAKTLESFIQPKHLCQIVACIEATIPFVAPTDYGLSSSDRLYKRLLETNKKFALNFTEKEAIETVNKSVRIANRDISGFGAATEVFLDNTWNLLPETNHALIYANSYTIYEYRVALEKTFGFLSSLNPEHIFRQFDSKPDDKTYQNLVEQARKNLTVGKLYLGSKLFSIAFIEALSLRVGLNLPLSTMMGEVCLDSSETINPAQLEDFLPEITNPYQAKNDLEREVLNLLEKGRNAKVNLALRSSPLATFMVKFLGFDNITNQAQTTKDFFSRKKSAEEFLAACNSEITKIIVDAVLDLFESRKEALSGIKKINDIPLFI